MREQRSLEDRYKLVEGMLLGEIDPKRVKDPKEAVRAIARKNLNSVVVIGIGSRMNEKVIRMFSVSFKSSEKRKALFDWLDSATDAWLRVSRR